MRKSRPRNPHWCRLRARGRECALLKPRAASGPSGFALEEDSVNFRLMARTAVDRRSIRRAALSSQRHAHKPADSLSAVRLILLRTPPVIDRLKIRPVPAAADQNAHTCCGRAPNKATKSGGKRRANSARLLRPRRLSSASSSLHGSAYRALT